MPTIIERGGSDSGASSMLVALVAIVILVGFALFMFNVLPFQKNTDTPGTIDVNVDIPATDGANK